MTGPHLLVRHCPISSPSTVIPQCSYGMRNTTIATVDNTIAFVITTVTTTDEGGLGRVSVVHDIEHCHQQPLPRLLFLFLSPKLLLARSLAVSFALCSIWSIFRLTSSSHHVSWRRQGIRSRLAHSFKTAIHYTDLCLCFHGSTSWTKTSLPTRSGLAYLIQLVVLSYFRK